MSTPNITVKSSTQRLVLHTNKSVGVINAGSPGPPGAGYIDGVPAKEYVDSAVAANGASGRLLGSAENLYDTPIGASITPISLTGVFQPQSPLVNDQF